MALIIKIDQDSLENAKKNYTDYAERMGALRDNLSNAVEEIRDGWKSNGGDEFFKKYDNEWLNNFNDYINVIDHMASNMQIANNKYKVLFDESDALKLE